MTLCQRFSAEQLAPAALQLTYRCLDIFFENFFSRLLEAAKRTDRLNMARLLAARTLTMDKVGRQLPARNDGHQRRFETQMLALDLPSVDVCVARYYRSTVGVSRFSTLSCPFSWSPLRREKTRRGADERRPRPYWTA